MKLCLIFLAGVCLAAAAVAKSDTPGVGPSEVPASYLSQTCVDTWNKVLINSAEQAGGTPSDDLFLLFAVNVLAENGWEIPREADRNKVLAMLDEYILELPCPEHKNVTEEDITDFYYENQMLFMETTGNGTFLIVDLDKFPDAVADVEGRLKQGEPLSKTAADFALPGEEKRRLLMRDEVQQMLLQCRQMPPPEEPFFMQQGNCVLWFEMDLTRRFMPLDDDLRRKINVILKVQQLGGWEKIFVKQGRNE